jgi:hypothetical protein
MDIASPGCDFVLHAGDAIDDGHGSNAPENARSVRSRPNYTPVRWARSTPDLQSV